MAEHKKKQKPPEEEGGEGAPLWIISFADMMSLLMAFFVMLSTFSNFGPSAQKELKGVLNAALAPYGGWFARPPKMGMSQRSKLSGQTDAGSEKPTLEQTQETKTMAETQPKDFRTHKVFLIESKKIFWSSGVTLSRQGKEFLDNTASYANKVKGRIVIAENGPQDQSDLGLHRAIVVTEYLTAKGLDRQRFNVSTTATLPRNNFSTERMVEISLLDENIYK
jgi:flagellar motor protein MotB